jgi:hypothetical protein
MHMRPYNFFLEVNMTLDKSIYKIWLLAIYIEEFIA